VVETDRRDPIGNSPTVRSAEALALVAPGTRLRAGIEDVIRAGNGALVLVANPEDEANALISGGFRLRCRFTETRLYELSKMDGAIVVSRDLSLIHRANAQLLPDPAIPSPETGLRHLVAHRAALQTGALILAVSARRGTATLYLGRHPPRVLAFVPEVLGTAGAALTTLENLVRRLREETRILTAHEHDNLVVLREVVRVLRTFEYCRRIVGEIEEYAAELGEEGNLIALQLGQLARRLPREREALLRDYTAPDTIPPEAALRLQNLDTERLADSEVLSRALGFDTAELTGDTILQPRCYRQLALVETLPGRLAESRLSAPLLKGFTNIAPGRLVPSVSVAS
jgi:diadenylate cyclase